MAQDDGLELTVESVPGDDRSDTVAGHAERERPTGSLLVVLLLLAAVVAVLLTDTVLSPGSGDDAASVTSADPGDSPLATFDAGLDTEPKEDLVEDAQPFPAVRLTPAANELPGRLALVPVLADDRREDVAVWVVTEGRSTTLYDTPIAAPGLAAVLDRTQPFLSTTDGVLAADERRNLVATSTNGSFTEVAADVVSLIDGDAPDELWILGEDTDLVRRLLPTGAGNRTIELLSVGTGFRTELAVTDGLIGRDDDDRPARWTPATGVTPLTSAGDGIVSVVGAAGDLVALAERDLGRVAVIDVGTDTRIAEIT
ncbi:MAG: hypothetical protein S0880_16115, partial [Actinomycetota bacterium]|nr:hypothetical protein [Actinomycetota bacterium]